MHFCSAPFVGFLKAYFISIKKGRLRDLLGKIKLNQFTIKLLAVDW